MDFKILEKAADALQDKLRLDEMVPDLSEQCTARSDAQGSHRYFVEPYRSQWEPMIEYGEFIPLPKRILDQYTRIECASFMGVLPEIERVWVTVDNKLFLWKYTESAAEAGLGGAGPDNCETYDGMSEVIVSVALSAPRPGVFLDAVKYVLVVASPVEVTLLAITCDANGNNFKMVPTAYTVPSDNVAMVKVVGSQSGRIFMAGNDGNVYELDYSNTESAWTGLIDGDGGRHKCRKINHFAWNWKLVHMLPPFLKALASDEDNLVDLAVDNVRHVVYSVTSKGKLSAFYLGASGSEMQLFLPSFNLMDAARSYLSGYGVAEGAPRPEVFSSGATAGCAVLSLSVLSPCESRRVHLVATLQNGIRVYLSVRTPGNAFSQLPNPQAAAGTYLSPSGVQVLYVRSPPPPSVLRACAHSGTGPSSATQGGALSGSIASGAGGADLEGGVIPSFIPTQAPRVSASLASHGATLLALDKDQHPDELVCLFEDLVGRSQVSLGLPSTYQAPSMREGVCIGLDETRNGGKIYDIQEDCSTIHYAEVARLRSLYAHSVTPANASIRDASHHHDPTERSLVEASVAAVVKSSGGPLAWLDGPATASSYTPSSEAPVVFGSRALHMACKPAGSGYDMFDLGNLALLGELSWQHLPCTSTTTRRHFLVLTNQGVHFLRKLRPADVLYRSLSQISQQADEQCRSFFSAFGALESSAMCVALACGLPGDAGAMASPTVALAQRGAQWKPLETMRMRAMSVMLGLTQGPVIKSLGTGQGAAASAAMKDSRMVISDASSEFVPSSAHDALYLVSSRILRPLWLRNVVRDGQVTSAWTPQVIAEVRGPLTELRNVLKGFFATAVVNAKQSQDHYLAVLASKASEDMVTRQMMTQAQQSANTERLYQQRARGLEDASIHALYRLVGKALQALSFIEVLTSVGQKGAVRVPWAKLGDITFRSLVVSARVHDSVKKLVTALINELTQSSGPVVVEGVVDWLSRECSFYFSAGDRCSYEATRLLASLQQEVKSVSGAGVTGSRQWSEMQGQVQRCVQLLLSAAKYWRSLDAVQGGESELWRKCTALLGLEAIGREGVVDVCLAAAANFTASGSAGMTNELSSLPFVPEGSVGWEMQLYRESVALGEAERKAAEEACYLCLIQHIMTVGTDVRRLGAGILPAKLPSGELGNPLEVAQAAMARMIVRALGSCDSTLFHTLLGDRLLRDHEDVLLSVRSPAVENYLTAKDPIILYRYYERHGECVKAATLMSALARDDADVDISVRIGYLQRAVASAERAVACAGETADGQAMADSLVDLRDTLEIAGYQQRAQSMLSEQFASYQYTSPASRAQYSEGQRRSLDLLERVVQRVANNLLPITELFHDVCMPYKLWDVSLLILNASKHDDAQLIARLWRSFIFRIVPDSGLSDESQSFLKLKRDASRVDSDKRNQRSDVAFEQAESWLPGLQAQVVQLAQQLTSQGSGVPAGHGTALSGSSSTPVFAFPSALVLEELEELAATLSICAASDEDGPAAVESKQGATPTERGWTARCLVEIGFSYGTLVESYMEIFDHWAGKAPEKLLHLLSSTVFALLQWTRHAAELSVRNEPSTRQLIQAARSGRVASWIEKLRRFVSTLGSRKISTAGQEVIALVSKELVVVNRRVAELTLA